MTWRFEGTHHFPDMPDNLEHVKFLENEHRHIFHCTAAEVHHDNRDVEYIDLKRACKERFKDGAMDNKSCEMIARDIFRFVLRDTQAD